MSQMEPQSDEIQLKQAIGRAWGKKAAPLDLRNRITGMIVQQSPAARSTVLRMPLSPAPSLNFAGLAGLAIAAGMLLALGLVTAALLNGSSSSPALVGTGLPGEVANSFVYRHDACCQAKDHHLLQGINNDSLSAVARAMSAELNVPVVATPIDGWLFAGAGRCRVWGYPSAHLLYRHEGQTLSVFSIPQSSLPSITDNRDYEATLNGHPLAAFSHAGGLYCVVGYAADDSISPAQVKDIRDKLRDNFPAVAVDSLAPGVAGNYH